MSDEQAAAPAAARVEIVRGGEPSAEEAAAIVTVLQLALASGGVLAADDAAIPASSEWALRSRMRTIGWEPLAQRWPGERSGQAWRRAWR